MQNKIKIKIYNKIAPEGLSLFDNKLYEIGENIKNPDCILLRSYPLSQSEIPDSVRAIGRAGAGVNNIPLDYCNEKGISVFNAPGANANAVKELVLCALLLSCRGIVPGINKINSFDCIDHKQVEKLKSQFKGTELFGKKLGVIGLGAIGIGVANSAESLGMTVFGYDPYISVSSAWNLSSSVQQASSLNELVKNVDFISLHVPLNENTRGFIGKDEIDKMKKNCVVVNFSRSEIVDNKHMLEAINANKISKYISDFPDTLFLNNSNIITMPHLGASTNEAETNCAVMVAQQIDDFLKNGNIKNSVNFPQCYSKLSTSFRVSIIHKNVPQMVQSIATLFGQENINIVEMLNKSKNTLAYTLIDVEDNPQSICKKLQDITDIHKVRVFKNLD